MYVTRQHCLSHTHTHTQLKKWSHWTNLPNAHGKVHIHHKHHLVNEVIITLLLNSRHTKRHWDLALDKLHKVQCTKVYLQGLRLAYGHLILQLVEVVHGRFLGRHIPSMQECLQWRETRERDRKQNREVKVDFILVAKKIYRNNCHLLQLVSSLIRYY